MTCQEYLALYSEYLDQRLNATERMRCRAHAEECASCARYDRVLRRGLDVARTLPEITPSYDFGLRLQHRIFHVQDEVSRAHRLGASGTAAALTLAGAIALAAWSPLLTRNDDAAETEVATAVQSAPAATLSDERGGREPLSAPPWWYGGTGAGMFSFASMGLTPMSTLPDLKAAFPGPYSPLVVAPPLRGRDAPALIRYNQ